MSSLIISANGWEHRANEWNHQHFRKRTLAQKNICCEATQHFRVLPLVRVGSNNLRWSVCRSGGSHRMVSRKIARGHPQYSFSLHISASDQCWMAYFFKISLHLKCFKSTLKELLKETFLHLAALQINRFRWRISWEEKMRGWSDLRFYPSPAWTAGSIYRQRD